MWSIKAGLQRIRTSDQYADESDSLEHINGDPCDQKAAGVKPILPSECGMFSIASSKLMKFYKDERIKESGLVTKGKMGQQDIKTNEYMTLCGCSRLVWGPTRGRRNQIFGMCEKSP